MVFLNHFIRYFLGWLIVDYIFNRFVSGISNPEFEYFKAAVFALIMTIGELTYKSFKNKAKTPRS